MRGDRPYTRVKGTGWERDERRVEDGKGGEGESERERERDEKRKQRAESGRWGRAAMVRERNRVDGDGEDRGIRKR